MNHRTFPSVKHLLAVGAAMMLALVLGAAAQTRESAPAHETARASAATRPTTAVPAAGCVTSECHADVKAYAVVHAPAASNDCESCHQLTDEKTHTFKTPRQKADMCLYCHEFSLGKMPVVHKPVAQGECLGCHNPHGGNSRAALREKSIAALCGSCHESVGYGKSFLHGPVAQGACDSCHPPHASRFPKLLDVVGSDLCLTCHKELEPALAKAKYRHQALDKGCQKCHDAHGSNVPMSLAQPQPDLCFSCHQKMGTRVQSAPIPHSAISTGRLCMNCHAPHASNTPKLQSDTQVKTCMKCHDKAITTSAGETIAATPEVTSTKLVRHGEIRDGLCSGCHALHGGKFRMLLKQQYTQGFYQQFAADNYALCFSCHDVQLAQAQKTTSATAFRNGDQNLHWVHANSGDRDKNCRTCHASHAAPNDRLLQDTFRFGKRSLPIAFSKTASGGSCAPGCHAPYAYDREHAVAMPRPTTQFAEPAATSPVTPLPRAERDETRFVTWAAKDSSGKQVKIPDPARGATALVILGGSDPVSPRLTGKLRSAVAAGQDSQIVLILTGETDQKQLAAIRDKAGDWSIILDPTSAAAASLEAPARPMALVLRADGLEMARISGESEFFVTKLRAYLDLASGRIDKPAATTQLSAAPVVEAPAAQQLERNLRAARTLIDQGKPQQAMSYLPDERRASPEALAFRAEALVELKRYDEAVLLADRIPAGAVPAERLDLIRAHALVAQERWYLARPLLEKYVTDHPTAAAAHLLLGRIYEHDQNWPKAAEQYRAAAQDRH